MTEKPVDLSGLSALDCCYDCNPTTGCVITGSVCGHPFKGGLQGPLQANPEIVARFQQARKILDGKAVAVAKPDKTGEQQVRDAKPKRRRKAKKSKPAKPAAPPAETPTPPAG